MQLHERKAFPSIVTSRCIFPPRILICAISSVVGLDKEREVMHSIECERVRDPSSAGPPIVMLHGYGAGSLLFANNMARLAQKTGRRVIAVDWLGCAGSGRPKWTAQDEHETIDWFLSAFRHWTEARDLHKFDLIGHSLGGFLVFMVWICWFGGQVPTNEETSAREGSPSSWQGEAPLNSLACRYGVSLRSGH